MPALALCTLIWGLTFVVVKDALSASDPFTFLTLRFALGALASSRVGESSIDGSPRPGSAWLALSKS